MWVYFCMYMCMHDYLLICMIICLSPSACVCVRVSVCVCVNMVFLIKYLLIFISISAYLHHFIGVPVFDSFIMSLICILLQDSKKYTP